MKRPPDPPKSEEAERAAQEKLNEEAREKRKRSPELSAPSDLDGFQPRVMEYRRGKSRENP